MAEILSDLRVHVQHKIMIVTEVSLDLKVASGVRVTYLKKWNCLLFSVFLNRFLISFEKKVWNQFFIQKNGVHISGYKKKVLVKVPSPWKKNLTKSFQVISADKVFKIVFQMFFEIN